MYVAVYLFSILFFYLCRQFPPEFTYPLLFLSHPKGFAASACCRGIVTTVSTITPNNAVAASIAIIAIDVVVCCCDVLISSRIVVRDRKIKRL